jgi:hypothetical protein
MPILTDGRSVPTAIKMDAVLVTANPMTGVAFEMFERLKKYYREEFEEFKKEYRKIWG